MKKIDNQDGEITKEKAFVLGVIGPGDGYVRFNKYEIGLAVIDKDFAEKFKLRLESIYGLKCSFKKENPSGFGENERYRVILYSKRAIEDLKKYGVAFNEASWRIPIEIKRSRNEMKSEYIAGFCDSQGSIGTRRVTSFSKNENGLKEMKELFDNVGLRNSFRRNTLDIYTKKSLQLFHSNIKFSIKRKQDKLLKLINGYKRDFKLSEEIDALIPRIKTYLDNGYSQRKTAKILGISPTGIKNRIKLGVLS